MNDPPVEIGPIYFAPVALMLFLSTLCISLSLTLTDFSSGGIRLKDSMDVYFDEDNASKLKENVLIARTNAFRRNKEAISKKSKNLLCGVTLLTMGVPISLFIVLVGLFLGEVFLDGWWGWLFWAFAILAPVIVSIWHSGLPNIRSQNVAALSP